MSEKEDSMSIDQLLGALSGTPIGDDTDYPLPGKEPVKFTDVDVVILPKGYKSEYPKPEAKDSKPHFSDSLPSMKLNIADAKEADGVLSVPVIVANAKHIYDYDGVKVHKPFDELKAAALFADGIPITREHPSGGIVTDRGQVLGFFKSPIAEDDLLKGVLAITDKDLIADVKEKRLSEVSAGFFCDLDETASGESGVERYDATQKNIFLNHIAVVENGRCSVENGCGIELDAKYPVPSDLVDIIRAAIERAKAMKDKSLLNMLEKLLKGISVKKEDLKKTVDADALNLVKIKDAFSKLADERDLLKDKLDGIVKAEKDSIIVELTSLQDSKTKADLDKLALDDLQKELDMVRAIRAKRLSVPDSPRGSGRDAIYGKVGKKGGK